MLAARVVETPSVVACVLGEFVDVCGHGKQPSIVGWKKLQARIW